MSARQREVYDRIVSGKRDRMSAAARRPDSQPELADQLQRFGQYLRVDSRLPRELS